MGNCACKTIITSTSQTDDTGNNIIQIEPNNKIMQKQEIITSNEVVYLNLKGSLIQSFKDLDSFCKNEFNNLENLNLSSNGISDISPLKNLKAPKLRILDLSCNHINNLDIFRELTFNLEELYIKRNEIEDLTIFEEETILKNLKKLSFTFLNNEKNKIILEKIKQIINDVDFETNIQANDDIINKQIINKAKTLELSQKK